jgi:hypothetical protein
MAATREFGRNACRVVNPATDAAKRATAATEERNMVMVVVFWKSVGVRKEEIWGVPIETNEVLVHIRTLIFGRISRKDRIFSISIEEEEKQG